MKQCLFAVPASDSHLPNPDYHRRWTEESFNQTPWIPDALKSSLHFEHKITLSDSFHTLISRTISQVFNHQTTRDI
jgi:hypothetical protein